jgi:spermidine/putrescine transport system permease protein
VTARRGALLLLLPALLVLLLLVALPQALMFEASLGQRSVFGGIVHVLQPGNYLRALEPMYLAIFARSLWLALLTTALTLLAAYPGAYGLALVAPRRHRNALLALVVLPFWTSFLVRMYAWVFLLRSEGPVNLALQALGLPPLELLYTPAAVLIGQVYGELPFMVLPLYAALERLDRTLLEAAADLGASPARALYRVTLPLTAPGIVAGCVLVFIPSLGAYLAPDLLGGAKTLYVGNLIQSQFAIARDVPFGAALAFLLSLLVLLLLVALRRPLRAARLA